MDWDLIGWSFTVIRRNKQLALFPAFSAVAALAGLWICMAERYGGLPQYFARQRLDRFDYLWLALAWFAVNTIIIFFNCALAACANAAMSGGRPTLAYGLQHAAARLGRILGWAVLSTTVGLILNAIERRVSIAGKLTAWLLGFAWALASYLIIPVLIAEDCGTLGAVRRSAHLARKTWGDEIVAMIRFGWRTLLVFVPGVVMFVVGLNGYPVWLIPAAVYCVIAACVMSAAQGIFEVALYRYAALGETPADWTSTRAPELFR